jgi:hypothetical protein
MRRSAAAFAAALAVAAAGCESTLTYPGTADYQVAPGFESRRPDDMAVLPVVGEIELATAQSLREALRKRLHDLRYAAVKLREVDSRLDEFRPGLGNSVMEVIVTKWDEATLYGDGTLRVSAEVRVYRAGSTEVLYRAVVSNMVVRASFVARTMEDRPMTVSQVCAEAAGRLLEKLPPKGDG